MNKNSEFFRSCHNAMFPYEVYIILGGGWLRVATFNTKDGEAHIHDVYIHLQDDPKTALRMVATKHSQVGISQKGLEKLKNTMGFTQLRFICHKKGKTRFEVITKNNHKGFEVVNYFTSNITERPSACGSFDNLPTDDSALGSFCNRWMDGKWGAVDEEGKSTVGNQRLYGIIAQIPGKQRYFNTGGFKGLFQCDDGADENGDQATGSWRIYVR